MKRIERREEKKGNKKRLGLRGGLVREVEQEAFISKKIDSMGAIILRQKCCGSQLCIPK